MSLRSLIRLVVVVGSFTSIVGLAQVNAGVSDERVSLPQAPGSISGVGENASTEGNQGSVQYAMDVDVPAGFPGVTPDVSVSYSSSGGNSVVGMGWSLPGWTIERMTSRGLQKYDVTDRFAVGGSEELVKVAESGMTATYRARFEGSFVRYTWLARGTGAEGSWKAEYPDGRVGYFGADKAGASVPTAQVRVPATTKTFAWHLVLMEDQWGHQMRLSWTKDASGQPLLERMDYVFEGSTPRHSVRFTYEARPDVLSDARPGFELQLTQRLRDIRIFSGTVPEQVRSYVFAYEPTTTSGGASRLASVTRYGRGDLLYPVKFSFEYSKTLGGACTTNCDKPFVNSMGTVSGVDFRTGRALLVDMNGDAIPDVVFSDAQGRHQFFYGKLDTEGKASFSGTGVSSTKTTGSSPFIFGDPRVQVLDVNGDGFVDLTQPRVGAVLCNDGSGDWADAGLCAPTSATVGDSFVAEDPADAPVQQDPQYVRFFDYDNDKRIDWLRTPPGATSTEVLANTTAGFVPVTVDTIGAAFDESPLQLADMNGDGLQDPVQFLVNGASITLQYKLNLGFGVWSPTWRTVSVPGFDATQAAQAELQDINGDGLVDVVAVAGNVVALSLNRNGAQFSPVLTITSAELGAGMIPNRAPDTTVTFADMNGNGSDDIVWFQANGAASYLELFPVRPNLISRIDNGIGSVQLFSYGTSISEQARDAIAGRPWPNKVPNPSVLVTKVDSYVTLTGTETGGLHEITTNRYHAGYYDGFEKQFRGYEVVDRELLSNAATDAQEPGLRVTEYDVGKTNPAFANRVRRESVSSLATGAPVLVNEERTLDELCPLADVPMTTPPIVFVCTRATTTIVAEKDPANARTLETQLDYDGYGNVTRETELGVKHLGTPEQPRACEACVASGVFGAPCGMTCTGDERLEETTFIAPGPNTSGLWLVGRPSRVVGGAVAGMLETETLTFYDGPEFAGLPAGQLTRGGVTRVSRRFAPGPMGFIDVVRSKRDGSGNVVESIEPNGTLTGAGERRLATYDAAGLKATQVEVRLSATSALRRDVLWDTAFEQLAQASNWYPVTGGRPGAQQQTRWRYDAHGRTEKVLDPGDTDATASTEYQYELADPASRILELRRGSSTALDLVTATCLDGLGRVVQSRTQLSPTSWQVSGFTEFDSRGAPVKVFQPYLAGSGACDRAAPQGVPFFRNTYDVERRMLTQVEADGSTRRFEYQPLVRRSFDEDDTDTSSPVANTPTVEVADGLGRLVSIERTFPAGMASAITRLEYDARGNLFTVKDPAGNGHVQQFDLMGRLTQVTNVNSGTLRFEYDAASNETKRTDARNKAMRMQYDSIGRTIAQWDESDEAGTKVSWTYDVVTGCADCTNAGGQLGQVDWRSDGAPARERFGYDLNGNILFREKTLDGKAVAVRYQYDRADRVVSMVYPGGITISPTWDGASRVASIPGQVASVRYTERDQLESLTFANGAKSTFAYDARLQLARQGTTTADGAAVFDLTFARTRGGQLTSITDASTRPARARHGASFQYDAWNRVTRAELDRAEANEVLTFGYDTLDNVVSQTSSLGAASRAHVGDATYDATRKNAVSRAGDTSYGYDAAGHLTSRGSSSYEFDALGRMISAKRGDATTGTFGYAGGPSRVVKHEGDFTTWSITDDLEVRDGIVVVYVRVAGNRVARLERETYAASVLSDLAPATGSGTLTPMGDQRIDVGDAWLAQAAAIGAVQLSGGPAPSPVTSLLASSARRLLVQDVTLHVDHLGSVVASTDAQGALVAEQSFYPTGMLRSPGGFVDTYGFTGQQQDDSTGLIHFEFRDLDPRTGRWASVDPAFAKLSPSSVLQLGQATTAYAYAGNDFANNVDPTGLAFAKAKAAFSKLKAKLTGKSSRSSKNATKGGKEVTSQYANAPKEVTSQYANAPKEVTSQYANAPKEVTSQYANAPQVSQYANAPKEVSQYANAPQEVSQYANAPKEVAQYANAPKELGSNSSSTTNQYGKWTPVSTSQYQQFLPQPSQYQKFIPAPSQYQRLPPPSQYGKIPLNVKSTTSQYGQIPRNKNQ